MGERTGQLGPGARPIRGLCKAQWNLTRLSPQQAEEAEMCTHPFSVCCWLRADSGGLEQGYECFLPDIEPPGTGQR